MQMPSLLKADPWQGQSKVLSMGFHCTRQPYKTSTDETSNTCSSGSLPGARQASYSHQGWCTAPRQSLSEHTPREWWQGTKARPPACHVRKTCLVMQPLSCAGALGQAMGAQQHTLLDRSDGLEHTRWGHAALKPRALPASSLYTATLLMPCWVMAPAGRDMAR